MVPSCSRASSRSSAKARSGARGGPDGRDRGAGPRQGSGSHPAVLDHQGGRDDAGRDRWRHGHDDDAPGLRARERDPPRGVYRPGRRADRSKAVRPLALLAGDRRDHDARNHGGGLRRPLARDRLPRRRVHPVRAADAVARDLVSAGRLRVVRDDHDASDRDVRSGATRRCPAYRNGSAGPASGTDGIAACRRARRAASSATAHPPPRTPPRPGSRTRSETLAPVRRR